MEWERGVVFTPMAAKSILGSLYDVLRLPNLRGRIPGQIM